MKVFYSILLLIVFHAESFCQCNCTPLQNTTTDSIQVSSVSQLVNAVSLANSTGNLTILVSNGVYQLTDMLYITGNNVTVRSKNRNRDLVTIRGAGMNGAVGFIFNVAGRNFKALDLTIGWVRYHAIQIHGELNSNNAVIQNIRFVDIYEQMLKVSYNPSDTAGSYNGIVECCLFEYSAGVGPNYYIGGIDAHNSKNWTVRHNPMTNIMFQMPKSGFVKLVVYDILGREIKALVNEELKPGIYEVNWDASNYPSGVYYYKIIAANASSYTSFIETKKMILI